MNASQYLNNLREETKEQRHHDHVITILIRAVNFSAVFDEEQKVVIYLAIEELCRFAENEGILLKTLSLAAYINSCDGSSRG